MNYEDLEKANSGIAYTDVKGKDYAEVPQRVQAFRKLFPMGTIETEIVKMEGSLVVIKATARDGELVLGTGHAYEKEGNGFINKTSYIENCETSAVGRALGFVGIGSNKSIASAEEVENAQIQQEEAKPISKTKVKALIARCDAEGIDKEKLASVYKVKSLDELTEKMHSNVINYWEKVKETCSLPQN